MSFISELFVVIGFIAVILMMVFIGVFVWLTYNKDRKQEQHPVLRNFPILGKARYLLENMGPELRSYLFNNDTEGKPFSRDDREHIVKNSKYDQDVVAFGSKRDFDAPGFFVKNAFFPKLEKELKWDRGETVRTRRYEITKDHLFRQREEKLINKDSRAYLLDDKDAIEIGAGNAREPFKVKGLIGMSAMSYGSLGDHAITALSKGIGMAKGSWMNTGEGGLAPYHLKGNADIIMQIGPGLFGVRDEEGNFDWEELKRKTSIDQVKAVELKLAQGAKTRGGHIDGSKVTEEIAEIRKVEPHKSIDSPNRFNEFDDIPSMCDFIERVRDTGGVPVGLKLVIGSGEEIHSLAEHMKKTGQGPDFITVDGSEGGTGASFQELADSVGLPIRTALPILDATLRNHGVRDQVKIIASGKMFTPDRIATGIAMGADLVQIARGFMITVGCINAMRCHTNECPVGVTTTDPKLQQALVVEEKKYRVVNYLINLRKGLLRIGAAAGIDSPVHFSRNHVLFKHSDGTTESLETIYDKIQKETIKPQAGSTESA